MNQLPENSLRIYDVTLVTSYLIGLDQNVLINIDQTHKGSDRYGLV